MTTPLAAPGRWTKVARQVAYREIFAPMTGFSYARRLIEAEARLRARVRLRGERRITR